MSNIFLLEYRHVENRGGLTRIKLKILYGKVVNAPIETTPDSQKSITYQTYDEKRRK